MNFWLIELLDIYAGRQWQSHTRITEFNQTPFGEKLYYLYMIKVTFSINTIDVEPPTFNSCIYFLKFWIPLTKILTPPLLTGRNKYFWKTHKLITTLNRQNYSISMLIERNKYFIKSIEMHKRLTSVLLCIKMHKLTRISQLLKKKSECMASSHPLVGCYYQ